MHSFKDKVVLVTGANAGIGKATAIMLAARGAQVIVAARRQDAAQAVVDAIDTAGGSATYIGMDLTDADSIKRCFEQIIGKFGRLDGAFNNAGVSGDFKPIYDTTDEEARAIVETNLHGTVVCVREEVRIMKRQDRGSILTTSSVTGLMGTSLLALYSATKHALIGLTKSTAIECAVDNIRVNVLCPGGVKTELTELAMKNDPSLEIWTKRNVPLGRMATPDEIAEAACFILSDAASFMTGSSIVIDGGQSAGSNLMA